LALVVCTAIASQAHAITPKPVSVSVTLTNATSTTGAYSGSQCQSNTYSGQCSSGNCSCIVVGGATAILKIAGKKPKQNGTANIFLTIDNGLVTGSPGCSPAFGVAQGFGIEGLELETFFYGTYCPTAKAAISSLNGGWSMDESTIAASAFGVMTGSLDSATNRLSLDFTGSGEPK
jgi:hypothetical protein